MSARLAARMTKGSAVPTAAAAAPRRSSGAAAAARLSAGRTCACGGGCSRCSGGETATVPGAARVGSPGDALERAADRQATKAMTAPASPQPGARKRARAATVSGELAAGGAPLAAATRRFFEPRLGADLDGVRVHRGARAEALNRGLDARAFAYGDHIWLGRGASDAPGPLMAHELAHVAQHADGAPPVIRRTPCPHDGGQPRCGLRGRVNADGDSEAIDNNVVAALEYFSPGDLWAAEVFSPPNPLKTAGTGRPGRIDGVAISPAGPVLDARIVEVKPCSASWGCTQATTEATAYLGVLLPLRDQVLRVSRAALRAGGMEQPSRLTPTQTAELAAEGITLPSGRRAIMFFAKLLSEIGPEVLRAYTEVTFALHGVSNGDRVAMIWPAVCDDGGAGERLLIYQANGVGGISYRCELECEEGDEDHDSDSDSDTDTDTDTDTDVDVGPTDPPIPPIFPIIRRDDDDDDDRPRGPRRRRRPRIDRPVDRPPVVDRPTVDDRPPVVRPPEVHVPLQRFRPQDGYGFLRPDVERYRMPPGDYHFVTDPEVARFIEERTMAERRDLLEPTIPSSTVLSPGSSVFAAFAVPAGVVLIIGGLAAMANPTPEPASRVAGATLIITGVAVIATVVLLPDEEGATMADAEVMGRIRIVPGAASIGTSYELERRTVHVVGEGST